MPVERSANLSTRVLMLGAAAIMVITGLIALRVIQDRIHDLDHATTTAAELARTLEAGVSATLQSAELVVDFVILEALDRAALGHVIAENLDRKLIVLAQRWPFIQSVGYIDAQGKTSNTVMRDFDGNLVPAPTSTDLSRRDTFTVHKLLTPATDVLFLSEVREGYTTKTPIVIMSKGIWGPDGSFLGIVAVGIRQDAIAKIVNSIAPQANSGVALFRNDGVLLLEAPETDLQPGRSYANSFLFRTALTHSKEGSFDGSGLEKNVERRVVYRAAPRYPFVIVVASSSSEILKDWRASALAAGMIVLITTAVVGALTLSLARRFRGEQASKEALRDSEGRLRDMLECSSDYMWETDQDERVIAFAGAGTENYPAMVGRHGEAFVAPTTEPSDLPQLNEAVQTHRPYRNLVIPALGRAGELRWVRTSANPKYDEHGVFQGYRGVGSDITEMRKQQQLIEAQRKTEALGRLASGLAHEINNLLQPILIYSASGAMAHDQRADARPFFAKISRAAEQASSIVRNVLTFTRRSPPARERIWLAGVVREIVELMSVRIPPSVVIAVDAVSLDRIVHIDRTGLGQAVMNLLTNAVESVADSPSQGGKVEVSASDIRIGASGPETHVLRPGFYCRLCITDNGPGIPAGRLANIFDPYFTTKAQGQGTGLGLSVVEGLAKTWGGAVTAASVPGQRTEFAVYLPQVEQQQINAAQ